MRILAVLAALFLSLPAWAQQGLTNIDNQQMEALMARGVPVVDVRTPAEWQQTGTVMGAKRITAFDERGKPVPDFTAKLAQVAGPGDEVVLICRSGNRSKAMGEALTKQLGYSRVYNSTRGMNGWLGEGRPVER